MNVSNLAFYIGKSANRNVVIFSYNLNNGIINHSNPLNSYWIMREDNNRTEDLNYIEKSRAFGHEIIDNPFNNDDIHFKIVSIDDIFIIRKNSDSKYNVIIVLDNDTGTSEYVLKKVFIHLSGVLQQTVTQIDFIYEDPDTKKLHTHERKIN